MTEKGHTYKKMCIADIYFFDLPAAREILNTALVSQGRNGGDEDICQKK